MAGKEPVSYTHLYKMDVLLSGSLEDRARLILDCQEEVKSIEQRIDVYKRQLVV